MDVAGPSSPVLLAVENGSVLKGTIPHSATPPAIAPVPLDSPRLGESTFLPHSKAQILLVLESDRLDLKRLCVLKRELLDLSPSHFLYL